MSNVSLIGKQHHHLEAPSANQETPVELRGEHGERVYISQRRWPIVFGGFL